jgi:hypothetical protein
MSRPPIYLAAAGSRMEVLEEISIEVIIAM